MLASAKKAIHIMLTKEVLEDERFFTFLVMAESLVNTRPLMVTVLPAASEDLKPLFFRTYVHCTGLDKYFAVRLRGAATIEN